MTHQEIEAREIVEAYLQGKLSDNDRQAFEEHFFACDACFAEVRAAEKFVAGVRQAAEAGLLPEAPQPETRQKESAAGRWWQPVFGLGWATAAVMFIATVWLAFFEVPRGRRELDRQRDAIEAERGLRHDLERQLAKEGQQAMARTPAAEGNLPLAMLEASRAGQANEVTLPAGASQLVLWIEVEAGARFSQYRIQIRDQAGSPLEIIDGLKKNAQGALAVSVPAMRLPAGTYTVLLHGGGSGQGVLVAEYRLVVHH